MTRSFKPFYHQAFLDTGSGSPVIILHGPFGNLRMWRHIISSLRANHRVVVPRLPMFGLPAKSTTIKNLAEVLFEFLDWHQLTDVTLIGHGLGGLVALRHAHEFPEVTKRLVITGTSNSTLGEFSDLVDDNYSYDYDSITRMIRKAFYDERQVTHSMVDSVFETFHDSSSRLSISKLLENSDDNSINDQLVKIHQPVLLAWGIHDQITPPEIAIHYHDHLANAELKFIYESGHLPMIEQSEQFIAFVKDFLNEK